MSSGSYLTALVGEELSLFLFTSTFFLFSLLFFFFGFFPLFLFSGDAVKANYTGTADVTNDSRDVIRTASDTLVWFESGFGS